MSRIDKALRDWEDSVGAASQEAEAFRSHPITIEDYARESSSAPAGAADVRPAPPTVTTPVTSDRVASGWRRRMAATLAAGVGAAPADVHHTDEVAARLVTTTADVFSVEQYRRLAATLHEGQAQGGLKSVLITSAAPREGKTLTGVNLAFTLSEAYARRVLLVDADLRCPGVHALLGIPNTRGLSEALSSDGGELPIVEVTSRLSVLTAGSPETPLAGLSSPQMRALLEECERRFDWVVVDTPPVGVLPDAQLLTRLAGAVVFVIGANATPAALVARAVAELGAERIIGTVLNRVEPEAISDANYVYRYHQIATGATS